MNFFFGFQQMFLKLCRHVVDILKKCMWGFRLACEAEERHMYRFFSVVVSIGSGGVNFCQVFAFKSFCQKL